jgi:hypothetical protein
MAFTVPTALADTAPVVSIGAASEVEYTTAHISATVNPEGGPSRTEWRIEYSADPTVEGWRYGGSGEFTGAEAEATNPIPVEAHLTGLQPGTTYVARVIAENAGGEAVPAESASFETDPVAPPTVAIDAPTAVTGTTAHFEGTIDPGSPAGDPSAFDVRWRFECTPECPGLQGGEIPADSSSHTVSAEATGLQPNTAYEVSLIAENAGGASTAGPEAFFAPAIAPRTESLSVVDVTAESADLLAAINPSNSSSTYHFEYVTQASFEASAYAAAIAVPDPDQPLGSGAVGVPVLQHIQGLLPQTTYRYRAVAGDASGTAPSSEKTFTTQTPGAAFSLPDDRGYEMVSPLEKNGGSVLGINSVSSGGIVEAAAEGNALTYVMFAATDDAQGAPDGNQYLSSRGPTGWTTEPIDLPGNSQAFSPIGHGAPYRAFSSDLDLGLVPNFTYPPSQNAVTENPLLTPDSPPGYQNLYLRESGTGALRALMTNNNSTRPQPARESFLRFLDATPDLAHVVVATLLGAEARPEGEESLYEWTAGAFQLVSILPGQTEGARGHNDLGVDSDNFVEPRAISDDGSRVIFRNGESEPDLYLREAIGTPQAETVQIDAAEGGPESGLGSFAAASSDGSRIFFTDQGRLTADSTASHENGTLQRGDLYRFRPEADPGHRLTDLTVDPTDPNGAEVLGVLGASEDGSYVYFVANGVLATGASRGDCEAVRSSAASTCNLYVDHEGVTSFIATLSGEDGPGLLNQFPRPGGLGQPNDWINILAERTVRISPDGRHLLFDSNSEITGYDNRGPECIPLNVQGVITHYAPGRCTEIYLYDASTGRTVCVSCNPTGAGPDGPAGIPVATNSEQYRGIYQSRVLSVGGDRVFFDSADALVPQDTNHGIDVYEWEAQGIGSCARGGGCTFLISGGKSGEASEFLDASANGNDVFFNTLAQLVPGDTDQQVDAYDAAVGGGGATGTTAVTCPLGGCQSSAAPAPALSAPGSESLVGRGNVKPKPLTRSQKLAKALRSCNKHPKRERASCRRAAHRRYGRPQKPGKHQSSTGGR